MNVAVSVTAVDGPAPELASCPVTCRTPAKLIVSARPRTASAALAEGSVVGAGVVVGAGAPVVGAAALASPVLAPGSPPRGAVTDGISGMRCTTYTAVAREF